MSSVGKKATPVKHRRLVLNRQVCLEVVGITSTKLWDGPRVAMTKW